MKEIRLEELCNLLSTPLPRSTSIPSSEVPQPYRGLLAHEEHMTETMEAHHGGPADVRVLESRLDGDLYSRKIQLIQRGSGKIILFGLVRIDLSLVTPTVRAAILEGKTPMGRVLIENDVLRRVEPVSYLRIENADWFGQPATLYGRLAILHCDDQAAIQLFEVVAPQ
jgi:chorismate-pyruvate lyase